MTGRRGLWLELVLGGAAVGCLGFGAWHARAHPGPFVPGPRDEGVLRVVTWNLGAGLDAGGSGLRDTWLEDVARVLDELEPDLVLLQELESARQLSRLRRRLRGSWEALLSGPGSARQVALLARGGELEELPGAPGGSRALLARWEGPGGLDLALACAHADAFSARERNALLGGLVERLLEVPAEHRLLGGDLNLDLDLDARRDLFSDDEYLDVETYNYAARHLVDAAAGRGSTAEPDRRLDYLFLDPDLRVLDAGPARGLRQGPMDHDPVVADFLPPPRR